LIPRLPQGGPAVIRSTDLRANTATSPSRWPAATGLTRGICDSPPDGRAARNRVGLEAWPLARLRGSPRRPMPLLTRRARDGPSRSGSGDGLFYRGAAEETRPGRRRTARNPAAPSRIPPPWDILGHTPKPKKMARNEGKCDARGSGRGLQALGPSSRFPTSIERSGLPRCHSSRSTPCNSGAGSPN
jgi:hypothetical protein